MPTHGTRCTHCGDRPRGNKTGTLCSGCASWKHRHGGQLPGPDVLAKRAGNRNPSDWLDVSERRRARHSRGT